MSPQVTAAIIGGSVGFITVIATVVTQYLGRRATSRDTQKALEAQRVQLDRTLAEQRTRTLNERFATAAGQLGDDKPAAVRLAGVYAMAGLADDWEENRQTCVDVLCAYLRLPYEPDPRDEVPEPERLAFRASREVRHTVIRVITAHLQDDAAVSWQGLNFDFTSVVFDGGSFAGARFSDGTIDFLGARFSGGWIAFRGVRFSSGIVDFTNAVFSGGEVDFYLAQFSGEVVVYFNGAVFSGGEVDFTNAVFSGGEVDFSRAVFSGGSVNFEAARFDGGAVSFNQAGFSGSKISFAAARFDGGIVDFVRARFSGSEVDFAADFSGARVDFTDAVFSGGEISFASAAFEHGTVSFAHSVFSGGEVDFSTATFHGCEVDFSEPRDWSVPPAFRWTDTPPSDVKLPKKEDQAQE